MVDILVKEIDIYQDRINLLEKRKFFWFQKEKLEDYNNEMNYLEDKIIWIYELIEKEIDSDMDLIKKINSEKTHFIERKGKLGRSIDFF